MATLKKIEDTGKGLTVDRETFFMLGYTWPHLKDKEFPFASEQERRAMWEKYRDRLMAKMYLPRNEKSFSEGLRMPNGNSLRPVEWWRSDAPEPRRILNGAKRVDPSNPRMYDREPLLETEAECLSRLDLLTDQDRTYMRSTDFQEAEACSLKYRSWWFDRYTMEGIDKEVAKLRAEKDEVKEPKEIPVESSLELRQVPNLRSLLLQ